MGAIGDIFHVVFYQPILNLLVGFYHVFPLKNFGFAIIGITLLTRFILWPLTQKSVQAQKKMMLVQPELEKLRAKFGKDKDKLYKATMELYAKHKVSPMSGCAPLLLQFPFWIAIYRALSSGLNPEQLVKVNADLYPFVPALNSIVTNFLWFDLTKADSFYILPVLVAFTQYLQTKLSMGKSTGGTQDAARQASAIMPIIFLFITVRLPSGLNLYIALTSVLGIIQQVGVKEFFTFSWVRPLFAGKKDAVKS